MISLARNKVCEVTVAETAEAEVSEQMEVVVRSTGNGKVTLRGVLNKNEVPSGARMVDDITMEEAYLAFMAGQGRHMDELDMTDS